MAMGRDNQKIPRADDATGLAAGLTVQPDPAAFDSVGCQTARLEQSRVEQPFIQPQCVGIVRHFLSLSAARTANGLSGSAFFSGRAV